jgi:hypothetical protein
VDKRGLLADPPPPLLVHVVVECPLAYFDPRKKLPNSKKNVVFILSNFLVRTLQCKKMVVHENMKKEPSKVGYSSIIEEFSHTSHKGSSAYMAQN